MNRKEILEKFFMDIGLEDLKDDESEKLFNQVFENMQSRLLKRISLILNDEERAEWEALKTDEELEKFYEEKGIKIDELAQEEAKISREELIQNIAYIKGKIS